MVKIAEIMIDAISEFHKSLVMLNEMRKTRAGKPASMRPFFPPKAETIFSLSPDISLMNAPLIRIHLYRVLNQADHALQQIQRVQLSESLTEQCDLHV